MTPVNNTELRIVHCFRSPIGGIFRHVRDLVRLQSQADHKVGIVCDSSTGGLHEERLFDTITPMLDLGLKRIPMARSISPRDMVSLWKTYKSLRPMKPQIVHCHSAKGGVYGRLAAKTLRIGGSKVSTLYCPHGGAMHYDKSTTHGKIYFAVERMLEYFTDSLVFVSDYERKAYHTKVGSPRCDEVLIYNGLNEDEFKPVKGDENASDFAYIGMMRDLKGPDVYLRAFKMVLERTGKNLTTQFIGDGPDKDKYMSMIKELGLEKSVLVHEAMKAREAFAIGKTIVVPSRAESMPYLVLEAVAAQKPVIATNVGGIPEIFKGHEDRLVEPGNPEALASEMISSLDNPKLTQQRTKDLAKHMSESFSATTMVANLEKTYANCL